MWRHPWSNVWALPLFVVPVLLPFISGLYTEKYNAIVTLPTYGQVEGFTVASFYRTTPNIRINHFLGVPFARRPSQFGDPRREFRFQKPERPSWTGIWNATYYRPACPQHPWYMRQYIPNYSNFSEDCLYLNVFAPNDTDERPTEANPPLYPVLVYIHGGGYTVGSGQLYPGTLLAQRRVVVVTFNYRLNALGFLSTGDQNSPGNYGLWDQVAALQFVKENIQYFRGNPNKITLVGHSTGASSVGLHMISPRSGNVGLNSFFDQAILMSGSDLSEWAIVDPVSQAQEYAKELSYLVGCPTGDTVQLVRCLRDSRTADDIVNASIRVRVKKGLVANPWAPVVDGNIVGPDLAVVPDLPRKQRETGQFRKIRVMAGVAQDDGSWFIPNLASLPTGVTENQFENILFEFLQDRGVKDRTVALNALKFQYTYWPLPREDGPRRQMVTDMMSDYMFGSTVNEVLQMHTRNHTFFYNFNYKSYNDYLPPWRGVAHGQELQYLFGFPFFNETYLKLTGIYPRQRYTYGDTNCSEFMMNMFTNFTSYGNPTSSNFYRREFYNTTWMQYNMNNHSTFIIQNMSTSYNRLNFRQTSYAFWRNYYPQLAGFDSLTDNGLELAQEGVTQFKTATWSLTAGSALLLIIIVVLVLGFYCRNKKKSDEFYGTSYA